MIIVLKRFYHVDIINNPWITFIYEDTDSRTGLEINAKNCKGTINSLSIRTKKESNSYYTDDEYSRNIASIDEDLYMIKKMLKKGHLLAFPKDGFGTGTALLRMKAPRTYAHLNNELRELLLHYRLPEVTETKSVRAYDSNSYKLVPLRASTKSIDHSVALLQRRLRALGVEVINMTPLRHLARDLYRTLNDISDS